MFFLYWLSFSLKKIIKKYKVNTTPIYIWNLVSTTFCSCFFFCLILGVHCQLSGTKCCFDVRIDAIFPRLRSRVNDYFTRLLISDVVWMKRRLCSLGLIPRQVTNVVFVSAVFEKNSAHCLGNKSWKLHIICKFNPNQIHAHTHVKLSYLSPSSSVRVASVNHVTYPFTHKTKS